MSPSDDRRQRCLVISLACVLPLGCAVSAATEEPETRIGGMQPTTEVVERNAAEREITASAVSASKQPESGVARRGLAGRKRLENSVASRDLAGRKRIENSVARSARAERAVANGQSSRPVADGRPQGEVAGRQPRGPVADHGRSPGLVFEREVFVYPAGARRDPFAPFLGPGSGPRFENLVLKGIIYSKQEQSVALLVDGTGAIHRVRIGDVVGNARVTSIGTRRVSFAVDEFGVVRRRHLGLKRGSRPGGEG